MVEGHIREQLEIVLWRAKNLCMEPEIVEKISHDSSWNGNTCSINIRPAEAIPYLSEAHEALRPELSDLTDAFLNHVISKSKD